MISGVAEWSVPDPLFESELRDDLPIADAPVPCLRLFVDQVLFATDPCLTRFEDRQAALAGLSFAYKGLDEPIDASDPGDRLFLSGELGFLTARRNSQAESAARLMLESFGATDIGCVEHVGVPPDVPADYLLSLEEDVHSHCAFTKHVLPQLRRLGWKIEIDPDYPFQVVESGEFYARLEEDEERPDWFGLELGVDLGGQQVSLLSPLLDLLDKNAADLHSITSKLKRCVAIPLNKTHHVALDPETVRTMLRVLIELYEGKGEAVRFPAARLPALEELDVVFGKDIEWSGREHRESTRPAPAPRVSAPPPELKATLRSYQADGLAWLQGLRENGAGGVLADDMGLGKTLQTIAHVTTEISEGRAEDPCLIVAPTSLIGNWVREFEKFAPHLNVVRYHGPHRARVQDQLAGADVVVTSYPLVVRDQELLQPQIWHLLVLDEAQTIKNARSRNHQAVSSLQAIHKVCLSGTPVENHLGELWALFDFLDPELLGSEERFRNCYRIPIEKFQDEVRMDALREQIQPYILRRVKEEVATELPPKTRLRRPVALRGKQRELYESIRLAAHAKVRRTIQEKGLAASTVPILEALMKLRQVCCDPRLVKMQAARFVRESAKLEALEKLLEQQLAGGHRALIFSQFTSMLSLIGDSLKERNIKHLTLTGGSKDRQALCDQFEAGEADVFLISLKAGGTGLNLVSADTVIHYDPWWNPQAQEQANDRAYRIGQTKPVFVYDLFVAGSVEERILALQSKKRRLADALLKGAPLMADDGPFSEGDVETLFAPLA